MSGYPSFLLPPQPAQLGVGLGGLHRQIPHADEVVCSLAPSHVLYHRFLTHKELGIWLGGSLLERPRVRKNQ
jgi:hypothetical protein